MTPAFEARPRFLHQAIEPISRGAKMDITFVVDDHLAERAHRAAQAMGKSLNEAVRDYLERLAGADQLEADLEAFRASTARTPGQLKGCALDRDDFQRGA